MFRLHAIHKENFIHRDFHSGNILLKRNDSGNLWKIGDLGLLQPENNISGNEIHGVIPYISPEIFKDSSFSKASDIYSMGMIMWELTSGCKPFANVEHDVNLIHKILDGRRPEITEDTPEFFANLIKRCWDNNPFKRPIIFEIFEFVSWCNFSHTVKHVEFKQAEEKRLELIQLEILGPEFSKKPHSKAIYTSRSLSSLISRCSSGFTSKDLNFDMDIEPQNHNYYNTIELNFDMDIGPQNHDYTSKEPKIDFVIEHQNHDYNSVELKLSMYITSILTSRKHNIGELNIEPQNDGKRIKADDAD
ncbi:kinase-like domain-containing protein [Rhizophagus clarus]|uniref:Kinase-like domain-containing protein n=1 Tax=Rhizophagus clarus TaxID=94130 RepID=A0A8H3LRA5_9GLOM|nr:kinase-like domain-containing protein [Rhizophagus clarus]